MSNVEVGIRPLVELTGKDREWVVQRLAELEQKRKRLGCQMDRPCVIPDNAWVVYDTFRLVIQEAGPNGEPTDHFQFIWMDDMSPDFKKYLDKVLRDDLARQAVANRG